jgi:multicomponent Na+:H+ antiporter subunit D
VSAAPLAVLVPLLAATVLAATSPFVARAAVAGIAGGRGQARDGRALRDRARPGAGGTLVTWFGGWRPRAGAAVGIDFAVDPIGGGLALFVAVLGVAALVMCVEVIQVEDHLFDAIALVFIAAMVGFCLTGDLFNLFVLLRADERLRVRARRLRDPQARAARGARWRSRSRTRSARSAALRDRAALRAAPAR